MAFLAAYTKPGKSSYAAVYDSLHLALSFDGKTYERLHDGTGVFFPEADYEDGDGKGVTKTLRAPWLFERLGGGYAFCAVRRNENAPDSKHLGSVFICFTEDFIRYRETAFLPLAEEEIDEVRIVARGTRYTIEWRVGNAIYGGETNLKELLSAAPLAAFSITKNRRSFSRVRAEYGNAIWIPDSRAEKLKQYFGVIRHVGVKPLSLTVKKGETPVFPKAVCLYSDGSVHEKKVLWEQGGDFSRAGKYAVRGKIVQKQYPFPFLEGHLSDPCVTKIGDRYFLSSSRGRDVAFRIAKSLDELPQAKETVVYRLSDPSADNMWAQELHVIKGVPYVFTTVGKRQWYTVRSHILRCTGDPADPLAWEEPRPVLLLDGGELNGRGISLDMTYFEDGGKHYVMWSNRVVHPLKQGEKEPFCEPAEIDIATIDPDAPWQLTSEPKRIVRPLYGWDRLQTEVDEGPYLLRHGDDLFVTFSGSSTARPELYCLGLMRAKSGDDLLDKESWDVLPYPVLTRSSVKGQYGPGHNNFIREDGDDLLIFHAVPGGVKPFDRRMGIRRVHFGANGYPYFKMTPERDLDPALSDVILDLTVTE